MKCGWVCVECRRVRETKDDFLPNKCSEDRVEHTLVQSPLMCKACFALGDDVATMTANPCPKALCFDETPMEPNKSGEVPKPVEEKVDKSWLSAVDLKQRAKARHDMEAAERELRRLQLLKRLQQERQALSELIAKKRGATSYSSACSISECSMINQELQISKITIFVGFQ